jgi:hypothetical protein
MGMVESFIDYWFAGLLDCGIAGIKKPAQTIEGLAGKGAARVSHLGEMRAYFLALSFDASAAGIKVASAGFLGGTNSTSPVRS